MNKIIEAIRWQYRYCRSSNWSRFQSAYTAVRFIRRNAAR